MKQIHNFILELRNIYIYMCKYIYIYIYMSNCLRPTRHRASFGCIVWDICVGVQPLGTLKLVTLSGYCISEGVTIAFFPLCWTYVEIAIEGAHALVVCASDSRRSPVAQYIQIRDGTTIPYCKGGHYRVFLIVLDSIEHTCIYRKARIYVWVHVTTHVNVHTVTSAFHLSQCQLNSHIQRLLAACAIFVCVAWL